jgi:hypothetical protein
MTDRYTVRVNYTIDIDVDVDHSKETPNDRHTGNSLAMAIALASVPPGAREAQVTTLRHLALSKLKTAGADDSSSARAASTEASSNG